MRRGDLESDQLPSKKTSSGSKIKNSGRHLIFRKIFSSAAVSYGYETSHDRRKAIFRYLLCMGKRNANLTYNERDALHHPEPFVREFEQHRYWRFAVENSELYYSLRKKIINYLMNYGIIDRSIDFNQALWSVKVLVKGGADYIADDHFPGARQIRLKWSEFGTNSGDFRQGERLLYCLEDEGSNTEIIIAGRWSYGKFDLDSKTSEFESEGSRLQVYLSDRGLLPDYMRLVDLTINLSYRKFSVSRPFKDWQFLDRFFKDLSSGQEHFLWKDDDKCWENFERKMEKSDQAWLKLDDILQKIKPEQIGDSADLYRQLILLMTNKFKINGKRDTVIWHLMEVAVRPYIQLELLDKQDMRDIYVSLDSLKELLKQQQPQTSAGQDLLISLNQRSDDPKYPWLLIENFLLNRLNAKDLLPDEDESLAQALLKCLRQIRELLQEQVFRQWVVAYERTAEIMLLYLDLYSSTYEVESCLGRMKKAMAPAELKVDTYSFPYAMNAIFHVVSQVVSVVLEEQSRHKRLYCLRSVYFEMINQIRADRVRFKEADRLQDIKQIPDILIADMHTNNARSDFLRPNDVCTWLLEKLEAEDSDQPVHLILDLTLNNPSEKLVQEWVRRLSANPRVNVYIVMSLTKLMQMGVDILSMGVCFAFGKDVVSLETRHLPKEPLRKQLMFDFLATPACERLRERFFSKIHENVNHMYRSLNARLLPKEKGGLVSVGFSQDDRSVYISLKFEKLSMLGRLGTNAEKVAEEILKQLQVSSQKLKISLSGRNSFGFSFPAINQAVEALRVTGGVEPKKAVDRLVEFLATFANLLSVEMNREDLNPHVFFTNFNHAVSALSYDWPLELFRRKEIEVHDELTGELKKINSQVSLTAQGVKLNDRREVSLQSQALLYCVYQVYASRVLPLVNDCGRLMFADYSQNDVEFLFHSSRSKYVQTQGQLITIKAHPIKSGLIDWELAGAKLSDVQIYVKLLEPGSDFLPIRYDRLTPKQRSSIFDKVIKQKIELEEIPGKNSYSLEFKGARVSLIENLNDCNSYDELKIFLEIAGDAPPVTGLDSKALTKKYQNHLFDKAFGYLNGSEDDEVSALVSQHYQRVVLTAHLVYRLQHIGHLAQLLDEVEKMISNGWIEWLSPNDSLSKRVQGQFEHQICKHAPDLTLSLLERVKALSLDSLNRIAISTLNDFVYEVISKDYDIELSVDAFKALPIQSSEMLVRSLESKRVLNERYHQLVLYWLKIEAPSLFLLLDLSNFEYSWFWQLKSFSKNNPGLLSEYWQTLAVQFVGKIAEKRELKASVFNQCIFWYLHIHEILPEADAIGFKTQICTILKDMISRGKFSEEQGKWLEYFYVYHEFPFEIDPCFLHLNRERKPDLRQFFKDSGMRDLLDSGVFPEEDVERINVYCGLADEPVYASDSDDSEDELLDDIEVVRHRP